MGLQVWLPLNGDVNNQGLADVTVTSGTAKYKTGKIGNGLDLSSRVTFNCPDLTGLKRFTIMFWVKIEDDDSITTNWQDIFGTYEQKADGSSYGQFRAETYYNPKTVSYLGVHWHDNANCGITSGTLPTHYTGDRGIWHHCTIVVDSDQFIKSYTDGVLKNEYMTGLEGGHLYNGVFWLGETNNIAGCVNDVRIYDNCLSPREVKEISKGLVLHYPLSMPGQENLIKNSSLFQTTDYWVNNQNVVRSVENGELKAVINQSDSTPGLKYTEGLSLSSGEYTATVIVKVENGNKDYITYPFYIANISTNGYERESIGMGYYKYTNTFSVSSAISATLYILTSGSKIGETWHIKSVKLERGSHPTPWIPNPADAEYSALGFDDGIEYDVSGYGNNGTKYGTLTYSSDTSRYNTSTVFNGTDNCIQFPFNDFCTNGDIFTMNIWWKKTALGSKAYETLIGGPSGFEMDTRSGAAQALSLYMATTRGGNVYSPFNMNEWYMVTLVNDGTNELYYVNGTLVNTIEKKNMPSGNYYVGAWKNETGQNFNGFMSDFRFYKTALSADDILELYHTPMTLANNGTLLTSGEFQE